MQFPGQCSLEQPLAILAENSDTYLCFHEALLKFNTPQVESPSFLTWSLIKISSAALFDIQITLLPLYFHSRRSLEWYYLTFDENNRVSLDNLLCKSMQKAVCTHSRATFFLPEQHFSRCTDAPDLLNDSKTGQCTNDDSLMRVRVCTGWVQCTTLSRHCVARSRLYMNCNIQSFILQSLQRFWTLHRVCPGIVQRKNCWM